MLVMQDKKASQAIVDALVGNHVSIAGVPIARGGWELLELRGADAIKASHALPGANFPTALPLHSQSMSMPLYFSPFYLNRLFSKIRLMVDKKLD